MARPDLLAACCSQLALRGWVHPFGVLREWCATRAMCVCGAFLLLCLGAAGAQAETALRVAQPNAARFPEVTLYALPSGAGGAAVGGMEGRAFRLWEDERPVPRFQLETRQGPMDICLALDRSLSMREGGKIAYAREAARVFLRRLGALDRAALISFGDGATLDAPLDADRAWLDQVVAHTEANGTTTTFLDAVYWAIVEVSPTLEGSLVENAGGPGAPAAAGQRGGRGRARAEARRVVVALTDGRDLSSRISVERVVAAARAGGVSLCMIALGADAETGVMERLAAATGGVCLVAPTPGDLDRLYVRLGEQLRREVRIRYDSPRPVADGTRREVRLDWLGGPGTARVWYQAPGPGSLLVTVPRSPEQAESVSAGAGRGASPALALAVAVGALVAVAAGFLVWAQANRGSTRTADARAELPPLWVSDRRTRIGRSVDSDVKVDSPHVSHRQAEIEAQGDQFVIRDLGSANGTYVNGRRVRGRRCLRRGDIVRFAEAEFRFAGARPG